jgi:hypothetical protein
LLDRQEEPVERPKMPEGGAGEEDAASFFPQAWTDGGESCPEGTVPVRRTTRRDVLRASSARRFGMKPRASNNVRRDSTSSGHEVRHYAICVAATRPSAVLKSPLLGYSAIYFTLH